MLCSQIVQLPMFLIVSCDTQPIESETVTKLDPSYFMNEFLVNKKKRLLFCPCPVKAGVSSLPAGTCKKSASWGVGVSVFQKRERVPLAPESHTSSLSDTVIDWLEKVNLFPALSMATIVRAE